MLWNWQLPQWPKFHYNSDRIAQQEKKFLLGVGGILSFLKKVEKQERDQFLVEILSLEGQESAKIEGELLDRESLQSSIKKHFGLTTVQKHKRDKEVGMAELLCDVYESFKEPLSHETFEKWHAKLFKEHSQICERGKYRTYPEPMQIVGHRLDSSRVFFEAPPSEKVPQEMNSFIEWFNTADQQGSILGRAAIAHIYFESIHPFEDGNGRIGRVLIEKTLSQGVEQPMLIAASKILEKRKKEYYAALEKCNHTLEVTPWVEFFADVILQAQEESLRLLHFIIEKSRVFTKLAGKINSRQEKVLLRMFSEGPDGFKGGLSAEKYIAITKTSKATATRDLIDLVEKDALIKTGELRHTRYWIKNLFL